MTDNITLPRAVVEQVREALKELDYASEPYVNEIARTALDALDAALAEPEKVPHTHEWFRTGAMEPEVMRCISCGEWGKSALAEPEQKPEPATHGEISEKFYNAGSDRHYRQTDYRLGWRAAERFHGITKEDK